MATAFLEEIYQTREVTDREGKKHKLNSEISPDEGQLIADLISRHGIHRTLEIGCAYGLSSLYICEALAKQPDPQHTIIDPEQNTSWQGIGVSNLKRAGFSSFELIEDTSERALPRLLEQKRTFQLALIDGFHTFDQVVVDFYFVDRLLEVGGFILLDDLQLPGIRKAARYFAGYPHYEIAAHARQSSFPPSLKRKMFEWPLRALAWLLPKGYSATIFNDTLLRPDTSLGLISEMVAFRKTGNDRRDSHCFVPF